MRMALWLLKFVRLDIGILVNISLSWAEAGGRCPGFGLQSLGALLGWRPGSLAGWELGPIPMQRLISFPAAQKLFSTWPQLFLLASTFSTEKRQKSLSRPWQDCIPDLPSSRDGSGTTRFPFSLLYIGTFSPPRSAKAKPSPVTRPDRPCSNERARQWPALRPWLPRRVSHPHPPRPGQHNPGDLSLCCKLQPSDRQPTLRCDEHTRCRPRSG